MRTSADWLKPRAAELERGQGICSAYTSVTRFVCLSHDMAGALGTIDIHLHTDDPSAQGRTLFVAAQRATSAEQSSGWSSFAHAVLPSVAFTSGGSARTVAGEALVRVLQQRSTNIIGWSSTAMSAQRMSCFCSVPPP